MPFLNQRKGENDHRNYFMSNLQESYVAKLAFELTFSGVSHAIDYAMGLVWQKLMYTETFNLPF